MATGPKQILDYDDYAAIPPDGKRWELWVWRAVLDGKFGAVGPLTPDVRS